MKNKFRLWLNIVTICLCVCAIAIGVYSATTANLNASGKIGFTAHGCDVKIVGQVSNAIKNSEEGSLFFSNNADYLNDMENFIGNDGWTIGSIIFDEESAMETPPIIITLDVYNYSFFPVFATLNLGTEFAEYLTASNIDVSAKVGTDDYVFGSEFYIDEAVYDSNAEFVSSTYKALENLCLSEKYSDFVRYVDTKAQFDGDYNYPTTEVPVNSRNPQTEIIQSNGVHPNTYGYLQIADAFYRALCSRYVVA